MNGSLTVSCRVGPLLFEKYRLCMSSISLFQLFHTSKPLLEYETTYSNGYKCFCVKFVTFVDNTSKE